MVCNVQLHPLNHEGFSITPAGVATPPRIYRTPFPEGVTTTEGEDGSHVSSQRAAGLQGFGYSTGTEVSHPEHPQKPAISARGMRKTVGRLVSYLPCRRRDPPANAVLDVTPWVHPEMDEAGAATTGCLLLPG